MLRCSKMCIYLMQSDKVRWFKVFGRPGTALHNHSLIIQSSSGFLIYDMLCEQNKIFWIYHAVVFNENYR